MGFHDAIDPSEVISAYDAVPEGKPLPEDGPCGTFYSYISSPGETIIMKSKEKYALFHIDYEDEMGFLDAAKCGWSIESGGSRTSIAILFPHRESPYTIVLSLHHSLGENINFLRELKSKRELQINLIGILEGKLVKGASFFLKLPDDEADKIEG